MSSKQKGIVVSRLSHPVTIGYEGMSIIIPPKAHGKYAPRIEDKAKLGKLPKGVAFAKR